MQASPKSGYDTAQRDAKMLRGDVLDLFAQFERAASPVFACAAALPEYKVHKPVLPHLLGQKLERLRTLMSEAGPLKSRASRHEVAPLLDRLSKFESLRHFMAHGTVEVALMQSGEPIYVFSMTCAASDGFSDTTLALSRREAQSRRARLADTVGALKSKLEAITDDMDKPPRHRADAHIG